MKLFIYLCTLLPLEGFSSISEANLYYYIDMSSRIREVIDNVMSFMMTANLNAQQTADEFYADIVTIQKNYGREMYAHFQKKYGAKAIEFRRNSRLSKDCLEYIVNLLKDNQKHQIEIAKLIAETIDSWKLRFDDIYYKDTITRTILANMEKEAYECGFLFNKDNPTAPFNCALKVLNKAKKLEAQALPAISEHIPNLTHKKNETLVLLHKSLADRFIPSFYDEDMIDSWLKKFCS